MINLGRYLAAVALGALLIHAPHLAVAQTDTAQSDSAAIGDFDQMVQIRGRVSSFDGAYSLVVRDEQGYLDNVQLHQGTIINPTGITLAPGMIVSIIGYNADTSIGANEIDTPYTIYGGTPFYQGQPWTYYGPTVMIGFFFTSPGWWHGAYFGGGYRFVDGRRYWAHVDRAHLFRGGSFHGRDFIADVHHGGWDGHGDARVVGHYDAHVAPSHAVDARAMDNRNAPAHVVDVHGRPIAPTERDGMAGHGYATALHANGYAAGNYAHSSGFTDQRAAQARAPQIYHPAPAVHAAAPAKAPPKK